MSDSSQLSDTASEGRGSDAALPVVVIGFGGHGRVVASALQASGRTLLAATDLNPSNTRMSGFEVEVISDEELLRRFTPDQVELALGIGSIWPTLDESPRSKTVERFEEAGFRFTGFRHTAAWVAPDCKIATTAQIHAGAIVQPGTIIRDHAIVNTRASIDHDCEIGNYCHVGPGVTLSGDVFLDLGCHIGTGASIVQGTRLAAGCFVGAGATVVKDIDAGVFVRGVPARPFTLARKHS